MTDDAPVRLIAFYLPQYYPIPENDAWWGPGFTDWLNVVRARPRFPGHYQPHLPSELGFYDLRLPDVRQAQARLARQYGIYGFCYYHYWFHGHRLLERPFDEVLASGQPDFPFCLCWANENWNRRWDGHDRDVLIEQTFSPQDDRDHIRSLIPAFRDPRYIRIEGKPLVLIYRVHFMPDVAATGSIWREEVARAGLPGIFLCTVISLPVLHFDPADIGFDAAVDFQPDWKHLPERINRMIGGPACPRAGPVRKPGIQQQLQGRRAYAANRISSYGELVRSMVSRPEPRYPVFPGLTPGWDNSPRRETGAAIFVDGTPHLYAGWLTRCLDLAKMRFAGEKRLVFVNGWNEWAEGNHLEPDQRWGRAYLEVTRDALIAANSFPEDGGLP